MTEVPTIANVDTETLLSDFGTSLHSTRVFRPNESKPRGPIKDFWYRVLVQSTMPSTLYFPDFLAESTSATLSAFSTHLDPISTQDEADEDLLIDDERLLSNPRWSRPVSINIRIVEAQPRIKDDPEPVWYDD